MQIYSKVSLIRLTHLLIPVITLNSRFSHTGLKRRIQKQYIYIIYIYIKKPHIQTHTRVADRRR